MLKPESAAICAAIKTTELTNNSAGDDFTCESPRSSYMSVFDTRRGHYQLVRMEHVGLHSPVTDRKPRH